MADLPITDVLPQLKAALQSHACAVLIAPPGAGKTTRVPLELMHESWLAGQTIIMLEPRRLAAKAAARFMARSLQEEVGGRVGYRIRFDSRVGDATRIQVVTEGILTRMLQNDPALSGVGLLIFDEFHERNLHADLGLALSRQTQTLLRPELRILVMSATLEAKPVAALLDAAPVLVSEGRSYPVETYYLEKELVGRKEAALVGVIKRALREAEGDVLVFLPGVGEIRRVQQLLAQAGLPESLSVLPLHGNLPQKQQEQALSQTPPGRRKIVLTTSIAETSLTVEGVRIVVDSGLMRLSRFSPRTGMSRLETLPVSRAAADQRRGRAGRQGPGVCYRLWTKREEKGLPEQSKPEILATDLASLALELAVWGIRQPEELDWLDLPPQASYEQAVRLLRLLGAFDAEGRLSEHGRRMAEIGLHPRLSHMILTAAERGLGRMACDLAALLSNRDAMPVEQGADLRLRLDALQGVAASLGGQREEGSLARSRAESHVWQRRLRLKKEADVTADCCGSLLALAYPDRIAQNRGNGRFLLSNGRGAYLRGVQALAEEPYLVAAELDDQGSDSRIYLAAPLKLEELRRECAALLRTERCVAWKKETRAVQSWQRELLGELVLQETPLAEPDAAAVKAAMLAGILHEGVECLPWSSQAHSLRQRLQFLHCQDDVWPDASDRALRENLAEWLGPYLYEITNWDGLKKVDWLDVLCSRLSWQQRNALEKAAPTHVVVPSGQRVAIDYANPEEPVLAVRLQEMFGLSETPRICDGRVPLLLHLLSPARRPVQVTRDLANFWRDTYFEVKKDLQGRYPKHYWPENPLLAQATHRVKAKMDKG
ncbi:ATP-dependent helicase HrpB [Azotosporobacter soli]|uniref:ATP-dependent helicase HrpB n=1 Tax=Azotosporobacter soli TaxID=3055040 RepID=UPI0031FE7136